MAERLLTLNMRKYLVAQPRTKRVKRAARYVKERVAHYTKTSYDNVKITRELNNEIVKRYARRMTPLRLRVSLENSVATVKLFAEEGKAAAKPEAKPKAKAQEDANARGQVRNKGK